MPLFKSRRGRTIDLEKTRRAYMAMRQLPLISENVLPDLVEFCQAAEPAPADESLFKQGRAAGRRDVWLHMQEFLHLTDEELFELYRGRSVSVGEG